MNITINIVCDSQAPLQDVLTNPFNQIVSTASTIYNSSTILLVAIEKAISEGLGDLVQELKELYDTVIGIYDQVIGQMNTLLELIAPFPLAVDTPVYLNITQLNVEWVGRAKAIVTEYSTFLIQKMLDLISTLIPVSFLVPVPFFGTIDIVQFFSDPVYRSTLKIELVDNLDLVLDLIPAPIREQYTAINGGIQSLEMQVNEIWQWFVQQITTGGYNLLHGAITALISEFQEIWDGLGLPNLVALLTLDVEALIESAIAQASLIADELIARALSLYENVKVLFSSGEATIEQLEEAITDLALATKGKWQFIINAVLDIEVFGIAVRDMVTFYPDASTIMSEGTLNTLISQAKDWATKYPIKLLLEWMAVAEEFFNSIGLSVIVEFITFTLCDFLELIGFPLTLEIEVPELPAIPLNKE
tara:strand:+ start:577 stop:1830 length:1254 start_codon:yes stop_codon:yes gene_type:complete